MTPPRRPLDDLTPLAVVAALPPTVIWAGAALAARLTGRQFSGNLIDATQALGRLHRHLHDPARSWPPPIDDQLPGAALYWCATILALTAVATVSWAAWRLHRRGPAGTIDRQPLGIGANPQLARRRDLTPLHTDGHQPGRFLLGTLGRQTLATQPPGTGSNERGAVALIGPSRSGKTTAAIAGILHWHGPAILSSVKDDLLRATLQDRRAQGAVTVFDPTQTTTHHDACWSPLANAATTTDAQRAARALCDAAPRTANGNDQFWMTQAELLLSGLLFTAAHTPSADMATIVGWILNQDRPDAWGEPRHVQAALTELQQHPDPHIRADAANANDTLNAIWGDDDRTRSSVYATARTVIWPWADPALAAASNGNSTTLHQLTNGNNTLYLCAPIEDQARLAPAFGGLLNDLVNQAYRHVARTGRPLDPPLLLVIDEAANTPLRNLPQYASTLAGLGVLLVTVWQSLAQLETNYGRDAGTILTNHLTKVFYPGLTDPESHRYLSTLLGNHETPTRSYNDDPAGRPSSSQLATRDAPLVPPHALRQMNAGTALLFHATLPPAHIQALGRRSPRTPSRRTSLGLRRHRTRSHRR